MQRTVYAHWLDPDYLGRWVVAGQDLPIRTGEFQTLLKMHALLGDRILVSDVQLIESRALLLCFANQGFRRFADQNRDFLTLKSRAEAGPSSAHRYTRVLNGLFRIAQSHSSGSYIPNTFRDKETVPQVAKLFQNVRTEGDAKDALRKFSSFVDRYSGEDEPLVRGLYWALSHFINRLDCVEALSNETGLTYYQALEGIRQGVEAKWVRDSIDETLLLAKTKQEMERRSLILAKLPDTLIAGHKDREHYLNVVQAWNIAVGASMQANCNSAFCFRGAYPIPIHSNLPLGRAAFTVRTAQEDEDLFASFRRHKWHPAALSWELISRIRLFASPQILAHQQALSSAPEQRSISIESTFTNLMEAAAPIIADAGSRLPNPNSPLLTLGCELTGGTADSFGFFTDPCTSEILRETARIIIEVMRERDAHGIGKALMAYGLQYNLTSMPSA